MGFTLEKQTEQLREEAIQGKYQKVAVSCWFTSNGRSMPRMVKFQDVEGNIQSIRNIHLIKTEEKYFAGIKMKRYDCCAVDCGIMKYFTLLYHIEEGGWDMVVR